MHYTNYQCFDLLHGNKTEILWTYMYVFIFDILMNAYKNAI